MASPVQSFPSGFPQGLRIRNIPVLQAHPGRVFWVGNNSTTFEGEAAAADSTGGGDFGTPLATIDFAVGLCAANRGDIIIVRPGHTVTLGAAAALALDVAGIALIGLGHGSNRPTISFATLVSASMTVTAANISMSNFLFIGVIDALTNPIHVQAADFTLENCEYRDTSATQATDVILTTAAASRMLIKDFRYDGDTAAGTNAGIAIVGGDRIVIDGLNMDGNFAVGGIDIRTTPTTDLEVRNVVFRTRNSADIFLVDTVTASTGMMGPSIMIRLQDNAANITEAITGATFVFFDDIFVVNLADEKALAINKVVSTDA